MAKRKRVFTKAESERRWRKGRGRGTGAEYQPWFTIQDVASIGLSHRIMSSKTGREHHLLSQNELRYFYLLEWAPIVTDIQEQFPLWHFEETEHIATCLGHKYPSVPGGVYVMTTDFLITLENGEKKARTVKFAKELEERAVLVKFDIEREYWRRRGIEWKVAVAEEFPPELIGNIEWLLPYVSLESTDISEADSIIITRRLTEEVASSDEALAEIAARYDSEFNLKKGCCLNFCKHLIINRQWQIDLTRRINPSQKLEIARD